ncbi:hypothetical protein HDF19_16055 [Mucilaginibacter sp. E4BP6]|uniref:hypothetical protein n=1 Tax=Mucilaginibacter sp. E4BP6 TaxID=2723089 RepID=UPI0015C92DE7|nr:hypothetical protein [Mucilaginibacter sp. E4BP6]NYE66601.1 hypothetical protein [Mucilaginibacter sp. E4BP6]
MKKIILTIALLIIFIKCSAQTKLTPGEIQGKHDTFIVNKLSYHDSVRYIDIYSKSNKYNNGIPYTKEEKNRTFVPMDFRKDLHVDKDAAKQIIYTILSDKLAALKNNKETMSVLVEFETDGKITDISFTLKEDTLVSLEDIEQIDYSLRKNITATFTGENYKHYIAINYNFPVIIF